VEAAATKRDDTTELVAVRAELDAKNTLIQSLRTDSDRIEQLEERLDEKRAIIAKLESSVDKQAQTIAELKTSVTRWTEKFHALKADADDEPTFARTMPSMPPIFAPEETGTQTDFSQIVEEAGAQPDRTIAINMRDALREAREAAGKPKKEKLAGS
jgi:uncharacterized coiled-coil protein SlyX